MCRPTSGEQIGDIDKESRNPSRRHTVFTTTQSVQAEVSYRQERIARDFRKSARAGSHRGRRHHFHLFSRHTG